MSLKKNLKVSSSSADSSCNVSPLLDKQKHQVTPLKLRSKLSKRDTNSDVHTSSSTTPDAHCSRFSNEYKSPTSSIPFSQDSLPEVIWDYTSPKLPRGSRRREINMTIDEFLKNMNGDQCPDGAKNGSQYIQLLEKWMTTSDSAFDKKPNIIKKRENARKNSRRFIEEMKQFLESMQMEKGNTENEGNSNTPRDVISNGLNSFEETNVSEGLENKSFLWGDDEFDSTDELWGDIIDSDGIIVRATQEMESCSVKTSEEKNFVSQGPTLVSTIPETSPSSSNSNAPKSTNADNVDCCLDDDLCKDFDECDNWSDDFLDEDESLSSIPDNVLQGIDLKPSLAAVTRPTQFRSCRSDTTSIQAMQTSSNTNCVMTFNESEFIFDNGVSQIREPHKIGEINYVCKPSENGKHSKSSNQKGNDSLVFKCDFNDNSFELFNSADEEAVLCKPEVLNWIDEVESQVSQNQKCTPVEIAQKKDEALKRRQKSLRKRKPLSRKK